MAGSVVMVAGVVAVMAGALVAMDDFRRSRNVPRGWTGGH